MLIERQKYIEALVARKRNGLVKVITGIRRCGKSFLLFELFKKHLLEAGTDPANIIEIAFDMWTNRPLSFAEFLPAHGGGVREAWRDYYTFGGLPTCLRWRTTGKRWPICPPSSSRSISPTCWSAAKSPTRTSSTIW